MRLDRPIAASIRTLGDDALLQEEARTVRAESAELRQALSEALRLLAEERRERLTDKAEAQRRHKELELWAEDRIRGVEHLARGHRGNPNFCAGGQGSRKLFISASLSQKGNGFFGTFEWQLANIRRKSSIRHLSRVHGRPCNWESFRSYLALICGSFLEMTLAYGEVARSQLQMAQQFQCSSFLKSFP
ncbi:Calpain-15 [Durusdinium trenchii]|uniref:Calpain-15 n=1 Tax=Durusdinium trenchii TaxID=1381693 RepID=A0ABP0PHI3_9DINO